MGISFNRLLQNQWKDQRFLCVGLDTDYAKLPTIVKQGSVSDAIYRFNRLIIEATAEFSAAYKPNIAFYEGYGLEGLDALIRTNRFLRENYPEIPIILDAKRADIGSTNQGYVRMVEEIYQAHAITVHPYLGREALLPFLERPHLGVIVLCHTSNPGAGEFQELPITGGQPLYQRVAEQINREWNVNANCSLVLGATYPEQLAEVRKLAPTLPFLIPGVGAQGGDLEQTVRNGLDANGAGIVINASRSIIYASSGENFAEAARDEAERMDRAMKAVINRG